MEVLISTNNIVTISFIEAVLKEAHIEHFIFDAQMSAIEGSIGVIPRRVMVLTEDLDAARRALTLAGLEEELRA